MSVTAHTVEVPASVVGAAVTGARRALVLAPDRVSGAALVRALENATFEVDWVQSDSELRSRAQREDLPPPSVVFVVPQANGTDDVTLLAELAYRSCARVAATRAADDRGLYLAEAIKSYAASRVLSGRQQQILAFYLEGKGDKEIAGLCGCSEATVYEHWRRMARKAGGQNKGDSISDFHRFLGTRPETPETIEGG
jgi:DNA-binding CsgD family transcriptional regulator